jgi:hypothetical protein
VAFGQHDAFALAFGPFHQLVLEHMGGNAFGLVHFYFLFQRWHINILLKGQQGLADLFGVIGRDAALDAADLGTRLEGAGLDRQDGYHRLQAFNQPHHRLFGLAAGGEHDAGNPGLIGR